MPVSGKSYRILIAEDNAVNLRLIHKILIKLNHLPETAHNGLEALQLLQRERFDFVLMDVHMPQLDGLETTQRILATYETAERPVIIAMTANAMKGDKERCLGAGMDDYLSKPIIIKELEEKLDDWGQRRKEKRETAKNDPFRLHWPYESIRVMDLDRLELLRSIQPCPSELLDLFHIFISRSRELVAELRRQGLEGNFVGMAENAHSLKGAALNYGAWQVAELCDQLEQLIRRSQILDLPEHIRRIESSLELASREIANWVHAQA